MKPLKEKGILNPKEMEGLFSNLTDIKNLNELILFEMKAGSKSIGEIFVFFSEYFKLYTTYCANQPKSFMNFQKFVVCREREREKEKEREREREKERKKEREKERDGV